MTQPESFLDGKVILHPGDCLDVLKTLAPNSVDSCVTDPPYELKFMGKAWDGTGIAFQRDTWARVFRVLKPGAHLLAFGGTRTYHRMACAIEDAGFEIRDQIQWIYGSGFPKSLDISKQIDKRGGAQVGWFGPWLKQWRAERGIAQNEIAALFPSKTGGQTGCVANWELGFNLPTPEQFNLICATFGLPFVSIEEAEREIVGRSENGIAGGSGEFVSGNVASAGYAAAYDLTRPATEAARKWSGFGTALKPACEPIVLARKPLSESNVAANVLKWGTGALNIDGCRVATDEDLNGGTYVGERREINGTSWQTEDRSHGQGAGFRRGIGEFKQPLGRWPANVIHDGSDEVVGAFPDAKSGIAVTRNGGGRKIGGDGIYGGSQPHDGEPDSGYTDSGSAARFFYTAKADSDDRLGSKHPTVKPLDLIEYLVRLVTPPGGAILDPFAGTGTAGEAAWRMGFKAILIEREEEYCNDIRRRMALCLSGPGERKRESIKARLKDKPEDHGPLFGAAS